MNGKKILSAILAALLFLSLPGAALAAAPAAEEKPEERIVERRIASTTDFLRFARSCARESYSSGVRFVLETDIDLTDTDFESVPYFAGEFDGGGHSVSGLTVGRAGSRLGLFRQIGEGASVHDLTVSGSVAPDGTREFLGGLCGVNAGTVKNCEFSGEVLGVNAVGGLIGLNTGSVSGCRVDARVCGEHQVGGVVGKNAGVLFNCESAGTVNAEAITPSGEKSFDLATLSQDDFTDLGDVGGVAGENTGVVRFCRAKGAVGWHYTGYNVGGIVGKNSGFVDNCRFEGSVEGRRDVGGVVGQSIPYAAWELSEGKLKELEKGIAALNGLLGSASRTIGALSTTLAGELDNMSSLSTQAMSAVSQLLGAAAGQTSNYLAGITVDPVTGEVTLPNAHHALADPSALTAAGGGRLAQRRTLAGAMENGVGGAAEDWQRISGQMSYIFNLLFSMMEEVGKGDLITSRDLSLSEAYDHDEGAVARCENRGSVRAELNAGGVVGCIAFELSFDKEDTLSSADFLPTQAERLLFAVVRGSKNSGAVASRGDCAGGVVGRMDVGAVVDCVSTGKISSQSGDYVGGIAGEAGGTLARCTARCELEGGRYVGGAAGLGTDLTECRAWTHIARASEYAGALAGWCEGTVKDNLYVADGVEGVDGVGRIGQADPVTRSEFLATGGLPEGFENVSVRFYVEGCDGPLTVRMRSDGGAAVFAPDGEGGWRALESEWDGRYLVFGLPNGGSFAVTAAEARHDGLLWAAAGGAALLALVLGGRAIVHRKKGKTPPEASGTTE